MDVLGEASRVASQPFAKITIPRMKKLLEKLRKSDRFLCLQHIFKDEQWLLWVSGETGWGARNSQAYCSNMPSVNSAHISTYTEATQTLSSSKPSLVKVCGKLA